MFDRPYFVAGLLLASARATVAVAIATDFAFFVVPLAWTHEPARLVDALGVRPGDRVADIGAGGSHAVTVATILAEGGRCSRRSSILTVAALSPQPSPAHKRRTSASPRPRGRDEPPGPLLPRDIHADDASSRDQPLGLRA